MITVELAPSTLGPARMARTRTRVQPPWQGPQRSKDLAKVAEEMEERSDRSSPPTPPPKEHSPLKTTTSTAPVSCFLVSCFLYAEGCYGTVFWYTLRVQCSVAVSAGESLCIARERVFFLRVEWVDIGPLCVRVRDGCTPTVPGGCTGGCTGTVSREGVPEHCSRIDYRLFRRLPP